MFVTLQSASLATLCLMRFEAALTAIAVAAFAGRNAQNILLAWNRLLAVLRAGSR
jgi:hypothetical protein